MTIHVGEVIAVAGVKITLRIFEESNKEVLFFRGESYKGVSIREYLSIQRGFRNVVCIVEGEYLDERRTEIDGARVEYSRRIEARPIGYFEGKVFKHGIKFMPMIKDHAFLLSEERISSIYGKQSKAPAFAIGRMLKEDIAVDLPWARLFNSHIAIFGNTGSGKSNTLAKLYTTLFEQKYASIEGTSKFVVIDFNGEYTGDQLVPSQAKTIYALNTQTNNGSKFPLATTEFWNVETMALLFQATTNTQRPFLNRLVSGRSKFSTFPNSLTNYLRATFKRGLSSARPRPESLDLLRTIAKLVGSEALQERLNEVSWFSGQSKFWRPSHNAWFDADGANYDASIDPVVQEINLTAINEIDELQIRAHLQLVSDLSLGYVQFDHIQPLLKRIESSLISLRKVLEIRPATAERTVTVVSLKRCNNEIKKTLPLLLAKHYYVAHRDSVLQPPNRTVHLIIDEAHNILSQQSSREEESWKDYRLEQFEEIIKEGRKFGVFITIASQRPADISPTIVSQVHNFFIHRLVNDRDLMLIDNTITTLDSMSRGLIPNLAQGSCVVTGTAFEIPMVLQVDPLDIARRPASEDVDLELLWANLN